MTEKYNFINETGVISVDTSDLLSTVEGEWKAALGADLETDASTPQGTLIQDEVLARTSVMKNNAELASVINPSYSYGKFLDAVSAMSGQGRGKNVNTVVHGVSFEGQNGIPIPVGSRVRTSNGDIFETIAPITLTSTGVRADLKSQAFGSIPMPEEELQIVDGVIGWGAVRTDTSSTVVAGYTELSDGALKVARKRRLWQQGVGSLGAIYGRLLAVDGVTSVVAVENATGAAGTVGDITFSTPNGVWVCVGGTASDEDIAKALYSAHMGGQPFDYGGAGQGVQIQPPNGVMVTDPNSPIPFFVKATRPIIFDAYIKLKVKQGTSIASASDIQKIVVDYANGLVNDEDGFVVGGSVSAFEIASAVNRVFPGLYVKDCSVSVVAQGSAIPPDSSFVKEWVAEFYQQAQVQRGMIIVEFV